jgi:hypothetical protein
MMHPWLEIPLSDYEAHMVLRSVGQSQLLAMTLQRVISTFLPKSLAVLGSAGGNGLELVDPEVVRRVVALDFNPDYLAVCTDRHASSFVQYEPILHDLKQGPPSFEPVECVFAGLVLEYIDPELFYTYLPTLVTNDGVFATLLQLPAPNIPEVSNSPFRSLRKLQTVFSFVNTKQMNKALRMNGYSHLESEHIDLPSGKSFYYAAYHNLRSPDPNCS